ncbi:MAG: hypothetical protein ACXAC6_01190 [Candidatus Hodarchaeales archaeon]|jgi:hypothetical protein
MGVLSDQLLELISQTSDLIFEAFGVRVSAEIFLGTPEDLVTPVTQVFTERAPHLIPKITQLIPYINGIYLKEAHEIWIVEGKGENISTLLHEMLHSIQECDPNRENITDYLVYKLTGLQNDILPEILAEWVEIEKSFGFKRIKRRFITNGDCEDF